METTQVTSLCIYLYLKLAKMPYFSNYVLFFFYKIREEEGATGSGGGVGTGWRGEVVGKRGWRVNMVQIMYTHVCKYKIDTCGNCSRNRGREDEREEWIFDTL
jgi:hypothetical protein